MLSWVQYLGSGRCDFLYVFLVCNSSTQIAGLSKHRPLQGSRQPVLISKGGVKEKSLLYLHTVPYILSLPLQTLFWPLLIYPLPRHLQQGVMYAHECSIEFESKLCAQWQGSLTMKSKLRTKGWPQRQKNEIGEIKFSKKDDDVDWTVVEN